MNAVDCPVTSCGAMVQRTVNGSLVDGLAAHLTTVHNMGLVAESMARQHITARQAAR